MAKSPDSSASVTSKSTKSTSALTVEELQIALLRDIAHSLGTITDVIKDAMARAEELNLVLLRFADLTEKRYQQRSELDQLKSELQPKTDTTS